MSNLKCEGNCAIQGMCEGEVRSVHVSGNGWDKVPYDYCEAAIAQDRSNGYTVEPYEPEPEIEQQQPEMPSCFSCGEIMTFSPSGLTYECSCGYWCYTSS